MFFSQAQPSHSRSNAAGHVEGQALHPEVTPRGREDQARLELHPPGTCLDGLDEAGGDDLVKLCETSDTL